jgi:hypothetical protein
MTRHVPTCGRAASTATTRAGTSISLDRGGGPKSISDDVDHAMALAEHHCAT